MYLIQATIKFVLKSSEYSGRQSNTRSLDCERSAARRRRVPTSDSNKCCVHRMILHLLPSAKHRFVTSTSRPNHLLVIHLSTPVHFITVTVFFNLLWLYINFRKKTAHKNVTLILKTLIKDLKRLNTHFLRTLCTKKSNEQSCLARVIFN